MTANPICDTGRRMGRKMLWPDKILAPLPKGSLARIVAVLKPDEDKTDFLRAAIEAELTRRERRPSPKGSGTE